ncbi:universal stress protein [Streptomyces megasporus]|uniref:universal stress protein n=1 Tax=Streptomyces megasporus TaxID=44060 RepID=UPI0004E1AE83|nr:universal stress protein [Streptomyces megasporus]
MPGTVIVGLDGSRESLAAADWAAGEARLRSSSLRVVHVEEVESHHRRFLSSLDEETRERWRRMPDEAVAGLVGRHPGLEIEVERLSGRPAEVLREAAEGAELLVLGSHGRGALTGFLVGSVALSTVAHVPCPLVLVRAGGEAESEAGGGVEGVGGSGARREVVVGLELSRPAEEVVEFAFEAAAARGAPLRVVHGWEPLPVYGINPVALGPDPVAEPAEEKARVLSAALRRWRDGYPRVEVVEQVVIGRPARRLLDVSAAADLVVVGRRVRRSPLGFHVGPVTHALMHHSPVPVAVVPYR